MSLLSYVSLVWLSYVSMAKGSAGDRNPVFIDCLDSCVEKLCKLRYDGGKWLPAQQTSSTLEERRQVRRRLHQHLETHYLQHPPPASPSTATRVTLDHLEKEEGEGEGGGSRERESKGESEGDERYVFSRPWYLAVMGWDCYSECKYSCMTMHVETRIEAGQRVQQYYGKWPFRRVWGVQELFSSLFSAGNGLPHLYHLLFSRGQYNPPGNYMRFWLTLYPWMGINTWLWSTVFHARDLRWTEAADYFCALLNIFFVVWVAIVRTAGPAWKRRPGVHGLVRLLGVSMSIYYVLHIGFMWFVKFDYGYNMKVALLAGLVHTTLWLLYQYRIRERPYAMRGAVSMILLNAAILLEVGDFSPVAYRLLDAHAIWHGVTIPLVFSWYRFVIQDARYEVSVDKTI